MKSKNIFQILLLLTGVIRCSSQEPSINNVNQIQIVQDLNESQNQNFFAGLPADVILNITYYLEDPLNFLTTHSFGNLTSYQAYKDKFLDIWCTRACPQS